MRMRNFISGIVLMGLLIFVHTTALAADVSTHEKDWKFDLAPFYLWAVSIDGDVTMMGQNTPLQLDFGDLYDNLEAVFALHLEGTYQGKGGFFTDVSDIWISGTQNIPGGPRVYVDFVNTMWELAGFYRRSMGSHAFEPFAGFRYNSITNRTEIIGIPSVFWETADWTDIMLGIRYRWMISEKLTLKLRGDYAFGRSNGAWNAVGIVDLQPWKHVSLFAGYRVLETDYDQGSGVNKFEYKVKMNGPLLGLNIIF